MAEQKPVPWERGSRGSTLSLGIKYRKEVRNGKLVNIDPRTGEKVTRKAHSLYIKERKAELDKKSAAFRKRNRETLATVSKTLFPSTSDLVERATRTGKYKLSDVPISNFDPQTVKDEGLEGKTYLTVPEADRLFRRQGLEGEIQQAKFNTANQRELAIKRDVLPGHPDYARQEFAKKTKGIGEDQTLGGVVNSGEILMSGDTVVRQGTFPSNASSLSITKGADGSAEVVKTPSIIPAEATTEKTTTKTPSYSTDVFTIDPATGEAVGVLTRNQRKKFEARADVQTSLAAWHAAPKNKLRIYKNKGGMMGKYEYSAGG